MAEPAAIDGAVCGGLSVPPPGPVLPAVFCTHCAADVTAFPPAARFCNRCGSDLPRRLRGTKAASPTLSAPPTEPFQPPLILLAYARALFNMGRRYESAVGSHRNMQEAARCYWKAARLGDAAARDRYDAHAMAAPVLPGSPQGLPGGSLPVRDPSPPFATIYRAGIS